MLVVDDDCSFKVICTVHLFIHSFIGNLPVLPMCRALVTVRLLEQIQLMIFFSIVPWPSFLNLRHNCFALEMFFLHLPSDVLGYLLLFW